MRSREIIETAGFGGQGGLKEAVMVHFQIDRQTGRA
jgi:hypothetical protein